MHSLRSLWDALSRSRSCSFSVALSVLYPHSVCADASFRPSSRQGLVFVLPRSAPGAAPCWSAGIPVACEALPTEIREAGDRLPWGQRLGGPPGCSRVSKVRIGKRMVTLATLFSHPTGEDNAEPPGAAGGTHSASVACALALGPPTTRWAGAASPPSQIGFLRT